MEKNSIACLILVVEPDYVQFIGLVFRRVWTPFLNGRLKGAFPLLLFPGD